MVGRQHGEEMVPPCPCRSTELLRGESSLCIIRASSREKGKLRFHDHEPHIGVQWVFRLGEQQRLSAQEFLIRSCTRWALLLPSTKLLRVGLALHQLSQDLILLSH
jgi:galactitol-specific phosphotransferase system IIC component